MYKFLSLLPQMWLTYAPIPAKTMEFYKITSLQVDFFSISFFITSLVVGFFSMYVLDTRGLGPAVRLCTTHRALARVGSGRGRVRVCGGGRSVV